MSREKSKTMPDGFQIVDLTFLDKGLKSVDGFNSRPIGGQYQVLTKNNLVFGAIKQPIRDWHVLIIYRISKVKCDPTTNSVAVVSFKREARYA